MNPSHCDIPNPLVRDGTGQPRRFLRALSPHYARVDERPISDFLRFAREYARLLQYWDDNNRPKGDWEEFFRGDASSVLAEIACLDLAPYRKYSDKFLTASAQQIRNDGVLPQMFRLLFAMIGEVNDWENRMEAGSGFKNSLARVIGAPLRVELKKILERYRCLFPWSLEDSTPAEPDPLWERGSLAWTQPLSPIWKAEGSDGSSAIRSMKSWAVCLPPPTAADLEEPSNKNPEDALKALGYSFEILYASMARLVEEAGGFLAKTLTDWPSHKPHFALWLAFLRLRQYTQVHLNSLTRKHLDFFFRTALQFRRRAAVPDKVHLLFEPAKQAASFLVAADTALPAGKDALGKEAKYRLNSDLVVNRAAIAEPGDIKAVFVDKRDHWRVYSAPIAASSDGLGKALPAAEPMWKPFGETQKPTAENGAPGPLLPPERRSMTFAQIGFAVASPVLDLREGRRTVTLLIESSSQAAASLVKEQFLCRFSGSKGWSQSRAPGKLIAAGSTLTFEMVLEATDPPVSPGAPELLGRSYPPGVPICEIFLRNEPDADPGMDYAYEALRELQVTRITVEVKVEDVRNLILQNDAGPIKAGKPFHPFGSIPTVGSGLYIGSDEVFRKTLTSFSLKCEWMGLPEDLDAYFDVYDTVLGAKTAAGKTSAGSFLAKLGMLSARSWNDISQGKKIQLFQEPLEWNWNGIPLSEKFQLFLGLLATNWIGIQGEKRIQLFRGLLTMNWDDIPNSMKVQLIQLYQKSAGGNSTIVLVNLSLNESAPYLARDPGLDRVISLDPGTRQGFIRLELTDPSFGFGHRDYARVLAQQTVTLVNNAGTPLPNPPFAPLMKTLSVNYTSREILDFAAAGTESWERFYHVYPFGLDEPAAAQSGPPALLPLFRHDTAEPIPGLPTPFASEGELYLGLSHLGPPCNLSLLFQVAEGSVNPDLPRQNVYWSYLAGNAWKPFQPGGIVSDTSGFIHSGIIVFQVPGDADREHSLMPSGKHWLRACVPQNSGAICSILQVATQAVEASFANDGNDPTFQAAPLPQGTISKLAEKRAEVKSVSQPYSSFGGRMAESVRAFDIRVSERLRHKGRSVAIWDYERLVLERFPSIHKVKCINHSTYHFRDLEAGLDISASEFAPGFVTVVVIPDQKNLIGVNPLEPRASLALLEEIKSYLAGLMPPFAARRLRVLNPLYETLQAEFRVRFLPGLDFGFHRNRLAQDIRGFLSPWAFGAPEGDLVFGGRVHRSTLLYFVEKLDYVDFVTEFRMHHMSAKNVEEAKPGTARSIFVSHSEHVIREVVGE